MTPQKKTPAGVKQPDTSGWLTRYEAMEFVGCSMQTLRNHEHRGKLRVQFVMREDRLGTLRETAVYDPKELTTLPRYRKDHARLNNPEERAARAYEMFREGRPLDEVVIELREGPDKIDHLYERWLDQTNARHVISPEAKTSLENLVGRSFSNVAELVDILTEKLGIQVPTESPGSTGPTGPTR